MNPIVVNKKSGFSTFDPILIIKDEKGNIFYAKENVTGKLHFNLPMGVFFTDNAINPDVVYNYKKYILPAPNVSRDLPKSIDHIEIKHCNNPHKCSIDTKDHVMYLDNQFIDSPIPQFEFIKGHEGGHYFYAGQGDLSEKKCDKFSWNRMIDLGYNPSQIAWACDSTLSDRPVGADRKHIIHRQAEKSF